MTGTISFIVHDESSICFMLVWYSILAVLVAVVMSYLGLRFQLCLTRRPRPVEDLRVDEDGSAAPPTSFRQSDPSDVEEHSPPFRDEGIQRDDWQRHSNDEIGNEIDVC